MTKDEAKQLIIEQIEQFNGSVIEGIILCIGDIDHALTSIEGHKKLIGNMVYKILEILKEENEKENNPTVH